MESSEKILLFIQKSGVSLYKLSKEISVSESTFSKWKSKPTSKIDLSIILKIAEYFGIGLDELLQINQVCEEEKALINNYRSLNNEGQDYINHQMLIAKKIYTRQDDNKKKNVS